MLFLFLILISSTSLTHAMDATPQLSVRPGQQLQQSVFNQLQNHDTRVAKVEENQKVLGASLRFVEGEFAGRLGTLSKKIDNESAALRALIEQKTRETRGETAVIRARVGTLEEGLGRERSEREAGDALLANGLVTETRERQADVQRLNNSDAELESRIDNTLTAVVGCAIGVGILACAVAGTWVYNHQMNANVKHIYDHTNKGKTYDKHVNPPYSFNI